MFELLRFFIIRQEIIVVISVNQSPRADNIERTLLEIFLAFANIVVKLAELNLFVCGNRPVNAIHIVMNAVVHRLDAVGNDNLTL